jgi:hypothetical protein
VVATVAFVAGCDSPPPPRGAPPAPPPVLCAEYPADRQDVVSCRYVYQEQTGEVWARSTQLAATSAISLGATHIQWLSVETRVDTVPVNSQVECTRTWGGLKCNGGPSEMPVGFIAVTRFALLSAAEAAARSSDPLVPAERRPMDARSIAAAVRR